MRIRSGTILRIEIAVSLLLCAGVARSQEWTRSDISGPQSEQPYVEFALQGKFLKASNPEADVLPQLVLRCQPGRYSSGHLHGKLLAAVLHVGEIVDGAIVRKETRDELFLAKADPDGYYVEFTLDDGEPQSDHWDNVLNYQAIGFGPQELNSILWGQISPHKEDGNPPVKKLVVSIQPQLALKLVIQFDMPDPTLVSELCGCTYFKKKD